MTIDWFIVGVILAVIALIAFVYRYHNRGATEITPSSFVTEALSGLEAPKSVDPEDDPLGQLAPLIASFQFQFPKREEYAKVKAEHGKSKTSEKALWDRAMDCVFKMRHVQQWYPKLYQAKVGNILPDEIWNMIQGQVKLVDDEHKEIRAEADSMVENGANTIFEHANRFFETEFLPRIAAQQRMAQQQAQAQAQARAAASASGTTPSPSQPTSTSESITSTPTSPSQPKDLPKQVQLKQKLEQQKVAEQMKKPVEDTQTQAQKQAAADKAYKELLRAEASGGKKSKKSKKDE